MNRVTEHRVHISTHSISSTRDTRIYRMPTGAPRTYRIPLVLLAAANLATLGTILWPWQQVLSLPVNGTAAIDPIIIAQSAYMGLLYWMSSGIRDPTRDAIAGAAPPGIVAGLVLAARVLIDIWTGHQSGFLHPTLLGLAVILWGVAGLRSSRAGDSGMGALSGLWSAMVSALIACSTIFAELYLCRSHPGIARPLETIPGLGHRQLRNPEVLSTRSTQQPNFCSWAQSPEQ